MTKILTPNLLWAGFDDSLPLKETKLKSETINNAVFNYLYFSGRAVNKNRVRIYGVFAEQKIKTDNTILILPDVKDLVDVELVTHFSNLGFNVLAVDLRGINEFNADYTVYPNEVNYANYENCEETFTKLKKSAKETCWYEWCAVARYSINFIVSKFPKAKIGVLGLKYGANVAWQLAGTDSRVNALAVAFGAGWMAYNGIFKHSNKEVDLNDEKLRFIAGLDAHSYAQNVKVPVMFVSTTNSDVFDCDRALDTLQRIDNQNKTWFNFTTLSKDVLSGECLTDIDLFFNKFIARKKYQFPHVPKIKSEYDDGFIDYYVECSKCEDIETVTLFASDNDENPSERVWYILNQDGVEDGVYHFKRRLYGLIEFEIAYAVVKYKNGLTISSKLNYQQLKVQSNTKIPNVIFSSSRLPTSFIVGNVKTKLMANVFSVTSLYDYVQGPFKILGVSTKNSILSYAIKKFSSGLSNQSLIKFDSYTSVGDEVRITLKTKSGEDYFVNLELKSDNKWQNLTVSFSEFKSEAGVPLKKFEELVLLKISTKGSVLVNNFLIL